MTTVYAKAAQINTAPTVTEASKAIPFGRGRVPSAVAPIQKAPGAPAGWPSGEGARRCR